MKCAPLPQPDPVTDAARKSAKSEDRPKDLVERRLAGLHS